MKLRVVEQQPLGFRDFSTKITNGHFGVKTVSGTANNEFPWFPQIHRIHHNNKADFFKSSKISYH